MRPRVAPRVAVCQRKASSTPVIPLDDHHPQPKVVPFQPRPAMSPRFRKIDPRRLIINADQTIMDASGAALLGPQVNSPNNIDQSLGDVLHGLQASRTNELLQASLDILSAHVVILDRAGTIVASNLAWQRFAAESGLTGTPARGRPSYLSLCDRWLSSCPQAHAIKKDLASVLTGHRKCMRRICSSQAETSVRWLEVRASRLDCAQETHVLVVSEDVTEIKEAEQALGEAAEKLLSLQEEERRRISEELHDSTAQHLAAAGLNLIGLRSRLDAGGEVLELLDRIESSLDEASKELRSLTYLLHPPGLEARWSRGHSASIYCGVRQAHRRDSEPQDRPKRRRAAFRAPASGVPRHPGSAGECLPSRFCITRIRRPEVPARAPARRGPRQWPWDERCRAPPAAAVRAILPWCRHPGHPRSTAPVRRQARDQIGPPRHNAPCRCSGCGRIGRRRVTVNAQRVFLHALGVFSDVKDSALL
jgi:PAS domain-containing protein